MPLDHLTFWCISSFSACYSTKLDHVYWVPWKPEEWPFLTPIFTTFFLKTLSKLAFEDIGCSSSSMRPTQIFLPLSPFSTLFKSDFYFCSFSVATCLMGAKLLCHIIKSHSRQTPFRKKWHKETLFNTNVQVQEGTPWPSLPSPGLVKLFAHISIWFLHSFLCPSSLTTLKWGLHLPRGYKMINFSSLFWGIVWHGITSNLVFPQTHGGTTH